MSNDEECVLVTTLQHRILLLERSNFEELQRYESHSYLSSQISLPSLLDPTDSWVLGGSETGKVLGWEMVEGDQVGSTLLTEKISKAEKAELEKAASTPKNSTDNVSDADKWRKVPSFVKQMQTDLAEAELGTMVHTVLPLAMAFQTPDMLVVGCSDGTIRRFVYGEEEEADDDEYGPAPADNRERKKPRYDPTVGAYGQLPAE